LIYLLPSINNITIP